MPKEDMLRQEIMTPYGISERYCVSMDAAEIRAEELGWVGEKLKKAIKEQIDRQLDALGL